ncbi:hypothetical protein ACHAWO_001220 [Cyclotella atomus]|uniref:Uncharacterized protein n=1 Tax=Cyclotella atomus TaxID=382360 RepID=A0ABD3PDZ7_9STRA
MLLTSLFLQTRQPMKGPTKGPIKQPSALPSKQPSKQPSKGPTKKPLSPTSIPPTMQAPRTTIEMASTLKWNISCSVLNDPRSLIDVAQIIERSTYDDIAPLLTIETIELVYVYSI